MGEEGLNRELETNHLAASDLTDDFVKTNFSKNNLQNLEDIYVEIAKGNLSIKTVIAKLTGQLVDRDLSLQKQMEKNHRILTTNSETGVVVEGLPNPQIKLANCCMPIPGDKIIGYISKGNGIVVHRNDCLNANSLEKQRFLTLEWASKIERKYPVCIKVSATQSNSVIGDIINTINAHNVGIAQISTTTDINFEVVVKLKILVNNKLQLDNLFVNLARVSNVHGIERE